MDVWIYDLNFFDEFTENSRPFFFFNREFGKLWNSTIFSFFEEKNKISHFNSFSSEETLFCQNWRTALRPSPILQKQFSSDEKELKCEIFFFSSKKEQVVEFQSFSNSRLKKTKTVESYGELNLPPTNNDKYKKRKESKERNLKK